MHLSNIIKKICLIIKITYLDKTKQVKDILSINIDAETNYIKIWYKRKILY